MQLDAIRVDGGKPGDWVPAAAMDSERRVRAALDHVSPAFRQMVIDVCCLGKTLKEGSYGHLDNDEKKMARFKIALDELCSTYNRSACR